MFLLNSDKHGMSYPKSRFDVENADEDNRDYSFILELCSILLIDPYTFTEKEKKAGYCFFNTYDEDIDIFGGRQSERLDDGSYPSYVELKGHSLRMFEKRCLEKNIDPFEQYAKLFTFFFKNQNNAKKLSFKRLDVAIDDYSNSITILELQSKLRKGFYVSNASKIRFDYDYDKDTDIEFNEEDGIVKEISTDRGFSCYIGGRTSRQLNIYDKKAEREENGVSVVTPYWLRYEARFYQDNANTAFMFLWNNVYKNKNKNNFNWAVGSLLRKIVILKDDNKETKGNQYRVDNWSKWDELTESDDDCYFHVQYEKEKDVTFNKSKLWLVKSPYMNLTLEFLVEADIDYNRGFLHLNNVPIPKLYEMCGLHFNDYFMQFILELLIKGKDKLDNIKLSKVNNMRTAKGYCRIETLLDAQTIIENYVLKQGNFHFEYDFVEKDY